MHRRRFVIYAPPSAPARGGRAPALPGPVAAPHLQLSPSGGLCPSLATVVHRKPSAAGLTPPPRHDTFGLVVEKGGSQNDFAEAPQLGLHPSVRRVGVKNEASLSLCGEISWALRELTSI